MEKLINISQLSKLLNLINSKTKKPSNYILRYWEKEFKQIKPMILKNRRYYSEKQINMIKLIKFLLKDKGMTINGVKKLLNSNNSLKLYETKKNSISDNNLKIKAKLKKILNLSRELKKLK